MQHDMQTMDLYPEEGNIRAFVRENNKYRKMASRFEVARKLLSAWEKLEEPMRFGPLATVIQSGQFETCIFAVIFVNCAFTVYAANWDIARRDEPEPLGMQITAATFLGLYAAELALKLYVHRCFFFCNSDAAWNIFDLGLVLVDIFDNILSLYTNRGYSVAFGRTIRVMKVTRVLRFVRVVHFLSELRLMLNCLMGSISSLMWSFILLGLIKLMFAIAIVQHLANLLSSSDSRISDAERADIIKYFGSIEQATLTLFMSISGGTDWADIYDLVKLSGHMGSFMFLTYIFYVAGCHEHHHEHFH